MKLQHATAVAVLLLVRSAAAQSDSLVLSSASTVPNGTTTLDLSLASPAGSEPAGIQWTLTYTPADVLSISASAGTALTTKGKSLTCSGNVGSYTCLATGLSLNTISNGVVAGVTVTVARTTSIGVTKALGASVSANAIGVSATGGTVSVVQPVSLSVNPTSAVRRASQNQAFTATVTGSANTAVTWSLSPNVGNVSSGGLYTAPATINNQQTVTVTATSVADPTKSASASVTLLPIVAVSISPAIATLTASQVQSFMAMVTGNTNTAVTWSLSSPVGTLSSTGLYTAPPTISGQQTITVAATSVADSTKSANATVTLMPSSSGFTPIRVNASGGAPYTDPLGQVWVADTGHDGGYTYSTGSPIANTTTPLLYQSERFGNFQYQFAVPNGVYTVTLKFAEIYWSQPGCRVFNVNINGQSVLANFDILAQTGVPYVAIDKPFPVSVSNGQITVQFVTLVDNAKISGIEIVAQSGGGTGVSVSLNPTSAVLRTSQNQAFTATVAGSANTAVTWSLSPNVGNVSSGGLYTAPATINNQQTVMVTATSVADPTKSASASVTLLPIVAVSISPAIATLTASQTQPFTATVTGNTNTAVTWSLSAPVGTLSSTGLYAAPPTISGQQTITVAATSVADPTKSASALVTLMPAGASFTPIRVNTGGGPSYTDPLGQVWTADTGYNGGNTYSTSSPIANTTTPILYQSERCGNFQYQFAVPNGSYTVTLKFAEIYWSQPGHRIFNVSINGQSVLANFDILAQTGVPNVAIDKPFPVSVSNGQITVQFVTLADNAKISAIEIVAQSGGGTGVSVSLNPTSATLTASQTQPFIATVTGNTNTAVTWSLSSPVGTLSSTGLYTAPATILSQQRVTVTATNVADSTKSANATVTLMPSSSGFTPIRVNAGGGAPYTDPLGQVWAADTGYDGGYTYSTGSPIANTPTPLLYQSERFGNFQYQFAVPNGVYTVTLKFAEIYWSQPGWRIFNVNINGQSVLANFDILAQTGGTYVAIDKSFPVSVTNGQITVQFVTLVDNAKISAIEIK